MCGRMMFSKKSSEKLLAKGPSLVCYLCQSERMRQTIIAASLQTSAAGRAGNSERPEVNFLLIRAQSILACPSLGHLQAVWLGCGRAEGGGRLPATGCCGENPSLLLRESFFSQDTASLVTSGFLAWMEVIPAHHWLWLSNKAPEIRACSNKPHPF